MFSETYPCKLLSKGGAHMDSQRGKYQDALDEQMAEICIFAAQSGGILLDQQLALSLASEIWQKKYGNSELLLGPYALIPVAYRIVTRWAGCSAGTCNVFAKRMQSIGMASLVPIEVLLSRPSQLGIVHQRIWEQLLRYELIGQIGVQVELKDHERYLIHMTIHATNQMLQNKLKQKADDIELSSPLNEQDISALRRILSLTNQIRPLYDNFVVREINWLGETAAIALSKLSV
jgi:hypothetical protein